MERGNFWTGYHRLISLHVCVCVHARVCMGDPKYLENKGELSWETEALRDWQRCSHPCVGKDGGHMLAPDPQVWFPELPLFCSCLGHILTHQNPQQSRPKVSGHPGPCSATLPRLEVQKSRLTSARNSISRASS